VPPPREAKISMGPSLLAVGLLDVPAPFKVDNPLFVVPLELEEEVSVIKSLILCGYQSSISAKTTSDLNSSETITSKS
jgi:hypothetical protein